MSKDHQNEVGKAAKDSRTPKRLCEYSNAIKSARSWSAAVLCRFFCIFGVIALLLSGGFWLNSTLAAKKAAPRVEYDPGFTTVVNRINLDFEKLWREADISSAAVAPTLTIARRLSLGLTGTLPSLEEIRLLEKQPSDQAVQWWLTHLFEDQRYSSYVAERLARAYVGVEDGPFLIYRRHRLVDWLGEQLHQNRPYDQLVRSLINSHGIWTTQPEVNFITVTVDQNQKPQFPDETKLAGRVSRAFLGVRLNCVQCHNDFLNHKWQQQDFHSLAAFFTPADLTLTGVQDNPRRKYEVKFHGKSEKELVQPKVPFEPELLPSNGPLRERLAKWVTNPQNRAFAHATVNRVWALLFNRPFVEPVDDIPLEGPYPPGFEILADDFAAHGFDLQRLIRIIAATKVFQADSASHDDSHPVAPQQEKLWAAFPMTRMRPEQVAGSIIQSSSLHTINAESHVIFRMARFFQTSEFVKRYGDIGEDEFNQRSGTIPQQLLLMNGELVKKKSEDDVVFNASTRIGVLAPTDAAAVETAYLCTLTRRPTPKERDYFVNLLKGTKGKARSKAMEDLYWALFNTTEFSWNH
jgi:Protein of unknown function (DUF1553)/Protein of unknown function (DUF1549)